MTLSIFMVPCDHDPLGRRRFRPRRSRRNTGSPRITRIEDFVIQGGTGGNNFFPPGGQNRVKAPVPSRGYVSE